MPIIIFLIMIAFVCYMITYIMFLEQEFDSKSELVKYLIPYYIIYREIKRAITDIAISSKKNWDRLD